MCFPLQSAFGIVVAVLVVPKLAYSANNMQNMPISVDEYLYFEYRKKDE
jgi:hypothetical protein